MLDVENQLRKYGAAVEEAALVAALERPLSGDGQNRGSESARGRTPMLLALAASAVLLAGGAIFLRQSRTETVATASEAVDTASENPTSVSPTTENPTSAETGQIADEWQGYAVPAYVTDAVPAGMSVLETTSAADYDAPVWTMHSQLYWVDGKTVPDESDEQLTINWFTDDGLDGGLYGEPATIRGTEGTIRDGAVTFVDDGFQVLVTSSTFSTEELLALAEQLTITETGVQPLAEVPGGLTALPVRTSSSYKQFGATVPTDGHSVTYLDGARSLNIFSSPLDGSEQAVLWRGGGRQIDVAGRQVWISGHDGHPSTGDDQPLSDDRPPTHDDGPPNGGDGASISVNATWIEDGTRVAILAQGLTEEEVLEVIAAVRPASQTEW